MSEEVYAGSPQLEEEEVPEEELFFDPEELDEAKEEEQEPEQVYEIEEEEQLESEEEQVKDDNEDEEEEEEDDDPKLSLTGEKPISVKPKKPISDKPALTKPFAATEEQLEDDDDNEEEDEEEEDDDPKLSLTGEKPISVKPKKPISDQPTLTKPFAETEADEEEQLEDDDDNEDDEEEKGTSEMKRKNKAKMTVINSQSSETVATGSAKRQAEDAEMGSERKMKKKQKKGTGSCDDDEEDEMCTKEAENESVIKRIWSPDDEILIMQRMNEFMKKGIDPFGARNRFFESIEKSLQATDVSCSKLFDKMYKLKRKYMIYLERAKSGGGHSLLLNSHEVELHGLMKEFWGGVEATSDGKGDSTVARGEKTRSSRAAAVVSQLKKATSPNNKNLLHENILKEALGMLEKGKSQEVEDKWEDKRRKLHVAELKLYLARIQLVHEQTIAILDALMAADS